MLALTALPTARGAAGHTKLAPHPAAVLRTPARAAAPRRARLLPVRAYQSDKEEAAAAGSSADRSAMFHTLAKEVAGQLASEFASNEGTPYDKLEHWLVGSHDEEQELPPRTDQTTEESDAKRLMREAADYFGMPTSVPDAIGTVQAWLSNPSHAEESADSQMVARLLHRLLQSYEQHTGEDFEGEQHQYDKLYDLASAALGSSLTKRTLKSLVRAYLGI